MKPMILSALAAGCLGLGSLAMANQVVIYNWSEYIPTDLLREFERETGIRVQYSTYESNEVMYARLKLQNNSGYDLVVPSTYYISKMRNDGMLQPINKELLSNYGNLDPDLLNLAFDQDSQYSVPYLWGSTALAINPEFVQQEVTSWAQLWQPQWRNQLLLTDDVREVFHVALTSLGFSGNSSDPAEIEAAFEYLRQLMPNVLLFNSDAPREPFLSGDVGIGMMWNGEVGMAADDGMELTYIYPEEGAIFWMDSFAIPSGAANVENAHRFIDFILRPENAARIVEEIGYSTPNLAAMALLDEDTLNNPVIFPSDEIVNRGEFHIDVGEDAMRLYNQYWQRLKAGR